MAPRGGLTDQEIVNKTEREDQVYEPARSRWVQRDAGIQLETEPGQGSNMLRRFRRMRSSTGGKVATGALAILAMVSHGTLEGNRVAKQRLRVMVRRKDDSTHTFIIVDHGEADTNGRASTWYAIPDPWLQTRLLVEWFRGSRGFQFFEDTQIPLWLQRAAPDGPECTWSGPKPQ